MKTATPSAMCWFEQADRRDPRGERIQNVLITATVATMPLGTAPLAIMTLITFVHALLRSWAAIDTCRVWLGEPLMWILLAWTIWMALSLVWASDLSQGLDDLAVTRLFLPFMFALWSGVRRMHRWMEALAVGVAIAAVIQLFQRFAPHVLNNELWWHDEMIADRYPGLLHPMLTGLLAAFTAIAMLGPVFGTTQDGVTTARRVRSAIWLALAVVSLLLTGSRAPLIAAIAGALIAAVLLLNDRRQRPRHKTDRDRLALRAVILFMIGAAILAAVFLGPQLRGRVTAAFDGLKAAVVENDYSDPVAARYRQVSISLGLWREHPMLGVGAGGYEESAREWLAERSSADEGAGGGQEQRAAGSGLLNNPHSSLLYALAVLGLPGIALFGAFWIVLWRQACQARRSAAPGAAMYHFDRLSPALVGLLLVAFVLDDHILSSPGVILASILVMLVMRGRLLSSNVEAVQGREVCPGV